MVVRRRQRTPAAQSGSHEATPDPQLKQNVVAAALYSLKIMEALHGLHSTMPLALHWEPRTAVCSNGVSLSQLTLATLSQALADCTHVETILYCATAALSMLIAMLLLSGPPSSASQRVVPFLGLAFVALQVVYALLSVSRNLVRTAAHLLPVPIYVAVLHKINRALVHNEHASFWLPFYWA